MQGVPGGADAGQLQLPPLQRTNCDLVNVDWRITNTIMMGRGAMMATEFIVENANNG